MCRIPTAVCSTKLKAKIQELIRYGKQVKSFETNEHTHIYNPTISLCISAQILFSSVDMSIPDLKFAKRMLCMFVLMFVLINHLYSLMG